MERKKLEEAIKLKNWIQQEFSVSDGMTIVILAELFADIILFTDITTLITTFGRSQSNRLALRRLQSAFKLLKKANLLKYKEE